MGCKSIFTTHFFIILSSITKNLIKNSIDLLFLFLLKIITMKFILLIFVLILGMQSMLYSQFSDDFQDGDLTSGVEWGGETNHFIVENGVLRLNAPSAGSSTIYTNTVVPDSFELKMDVKMDFDPSASNFFRLSLSNTANDKSYFLQFGENGSNDAIQIFKNINGVETLLASGTSGAISQSPNLNFTLTRRNDGFFVLYVDYGSGFQEEDAMFFDDEIAPLELSLFSISCTYTSTRTDKFYFDNISLEEYFPDLEPPQLTGVEVINDKLLKVTFNEKINNSGLSTTNFILNPLTSISQVEYNPLNPNQIQLILLESLDNKNDYFLTVKNIKDLNNNNLESSDVAFHYAARPKLGDLKLSEILFDPYSGGEDFIEIYNDSPGYISLEGLVIGNSENGDEEELTQKIELKAYEYLAISEDVNFLIDQYHPIPSANFLEHDLPPFDNANGNPYIRIMLDGVLITLDSMAYTEDQHFELIDDTEGVSLERISFKTSADEANNWFSSSENNNWATPGYQNSVLRIGNHANNGFSIENRVFAPGLPDNPFLTIDYNFENSGTLADVKIFNSNGYQVRDMGSNILLGDEGFLIWDGLNDENVRVSIGVYVIILKTFNTEDNTSISKEYCVVGDVLD